jgi:hypothetical protein
MLPIEAPQAHFDLTRLAGNKNGIPCAKTLICLDLSRKLLSLGTDYRTLSHLRPLSTRPLSTIPFSVKTGAVVDEGRVRVLCRRSIPHLQLVIYVTTLVGSMIYTVSRLTMGRLSKFVLLAVLLIIAGFPGATPLFCAQPSGSHGHACCMAHEQAKASLCAASSLAVSGTTSCCKIAPIESTPIQPILLSGLSQDRVYGLNVTSDIAGTLSAPVQRLGRGSPLSTKLQHSPVHALLCTFLV